MGRADFETLRALLTRGLVDEGDAEEMVALTRSTFNLVAAGFTRGFTWGGAPLVGGDLAQWMEIYPEVGDDDPGVAYLEASPEGTWYYASHEPTVRTETQKAFLDLGYHDVAIARFSGPLGEQLPCALYSDGGQFGEHEQLQLARLTPLFAGALRTQSALNALHRQDREACPLLGTVEVAFPSGKVHWSSRARAAIEAQCGRLASRGWRRFERALVRAVRDSSAATRRHRLLGQIDVEVAHVPPALGEERRALLLFYSARVAKLDPKPRTPAEELLSTRQRLVARLLVRGATLREIAAEIGIGQETVRQHMRIVMERLGVRKRSELAHLID
ncbi:MAG TPA: LuxR C-terminal-related transcriptional regulator [Polyangiaceae bacterium]|nr:LuxR C-terminal-related transcriptional regulator [Polyangiaceae bacterium]